MGRNYDFAGYATRTNRKCSDGRTIMKDAFKDNDGQTVPLVWNHQHSDPNNVLGHALLENRSDGVYAYCSLNDTESGQSAKQLVQHGDVTALSIYANGLKQHGGDVLHGCIREVSLVLAGANPGAGIAVDEAIPTLDEIAENERAGFLAQLDYMQFKPGERLEGKPVDYCFLGACTNGRIEDFRAFASVVKGKRKADNVVAWLVPGSWLVRQQIIDEGIDKVLEDAGFELRLPSCSACLAMNPDKVPAGKLAISTSNRNFVGRQGPGARTILASPMTVAASAITGVITNPQTLPQT